MPTTSFGFVKEMSGKQHSPPPLGTMNGHIMLFGLANSPSVFQAFINDTFRDMLNQFVIVYINNILIYSSTLEDHVHHMPAVLKLLISHQLYTKAEKCQFHQTVI